MKQHSIHTQMIKQVAERLGPLRSKVVFLGGSATGFHLTDEAQPEIRATKDVDVIVEIGSIVEYHRLEKTLMELGFFQKIQEDDPICRWYIDDVIVDVMPTDENILGFSNRWYLSAIKNAVKIELEPDLEILIVTAPYFLGTKLEAFRGRGKNDYLASHDMEDIINFINGRVEVLADIKNTASDLKDFISKSFQGFLADELFLEALPGHLLPDPASQARRSIILVRIEKIAGLGSN
jgi:predicted nucleotidyltransferase